MERKLLDMMNQLFISEYNQKMEYCDKSQFIETIYQLGTKDGYEEPAVFVKVAAELLEVIQEKYGSHILLKLIATYKFDNIF